MILYEDNDIIVCHKPEGIPVQSARLVQKDMVSILNNYLPEPVRVVHRLDQPVEGVIVFAKTKKAAAELSRQIAEGSMKKVYQAVCCITEKAQQDLNPEIGKIYSLTDYLVKNAKTNTSAVAKQGDKDAKRAELSFTVLDIAFPYLLAEIHLKTGRHHQIRVQMANAGLPLYGDRKYHVQQQEFMWGGPALCAASLSFYHPVSGEKLAFKVNPEKEIFSRYAALKVSCKKV